MSIKIWLKTENIEFIENFDFSKAKITFFAAGGKIYEKFAVIDAKN